MKLQLYVQQVNSALEETSQSVLSSLPRVLRDSQLLQQEALALKEKMASVKQEIAKVFNVIFLFVYIPLSRFCMILCAKFIEQVEECTVSSIESLERLDRIKTQLETAKRGLHEADNWSALANDVEEVRTLIWYLSTL